MILATIHTGSYEWTVIEDCEGCAVEKLLAAYAATVRSNPAAEPCYMRDLIEAGDVNFTRLEVGEVLRR